MDVPDCFTTHLTLPSVPTASPASIQSAPSFLMLPLPLPSISRSYPRKEIRAVPIARSPQPSKNIARVATSFTEEEKRKAKVDRRILQKRRRQRKECAIRRRRNLNLPRQFQCICKTISLRVVYSLQHTLNCSTLRPGPYCLLLCVLQLTSL